VNEVTVSVKYSFDVECPNCGHEFDCADMDYEGDISQAVFCGKMTDFCEDIYCPKCDCAMTLTEVEF
jgi:tRNA G26 N,N-dimethylase Trm1